jgi:hypothetical protein
MNSWFKIQRLWIAISVIIFVFSYAFVDANLRLSDNPLFQTLLAQLSIIMSSHRTQTAGIFVLLLVCLFALWWKTVQLVHLGQCGFRQLIPCVISVYALLVISYPFLSYDVFNYVTTAKVTFTWHENPYIVMPIEISNDPNLAFTRAANKVALYGPAWLLLTWIPHTLGMGNIWQTIVAFKLMNAVWYGVFCYMLWRVTKNMKNVIFFALNPLVIIETVISGHNDIVMMGLSCAGFLLWQKKEWVSRFFGLFIFILSIFIKGATAVLIPLLFFRKMTQSRFMLIASCLLFLVFLTIAPIREELYPWYAVWFLSTAAFLPYPKYAWFWQFCIALSFGLELRHVPYMAMGYYEGPGPLLRTGLTIIPVAVWGIWRMSKKRLLFSRDLL